MFLQNKVDTVLAKAGPGDTTCSICNQELTTTQSLRAHIISKHMKSKSPFKCQECDESFGSSYALKMHLRKHSSSAKKYKGRICAKEYTTIGHYNEHMTVHSGKQYICLWCSKVFQHKKNLKFHKKEACTKRPTEEPAPERNQCPYCYRSYTYKRDLQTHIKKKHPSKQSSIVPQQLSVPPKQF